MAPQVLSRARDLSSPALRAAIAGLSDELRPVAEYHLGWRDAKGNATGSDGGKGVRPALAVLSAEAVGAPGSVGVPGAVAIELVHNFSLIHDDVMDNDAERRHRPTVWAVFGIGQAVIVGDALLVLADQVLLGQRGGAPLDEAGARAARRLSDATASMIRGQALDIAFESIAEIGVERCLEMEAGKTGALLGCATAIGAALAGADEEVVDALDRFGIEIGLAFQAVDDLLGIWGDPETTGKPSWSDLRQHKKSLPIAIALAAGGSGADELRGLLAADLDDEGLSRAARLVETQGGRERTEREARNHVQQALSSLEGLSLVDSARRELIELAEFIVEREF